MAIRTDAHAISDVFVGRVGPDCGVEDAPPDEQGAGLRGTLNGWSDIRIPLAGVDDLRSLFSEEEDAVWLEKEIPLTV